MCNELKDIYHLERCYIILEVGFVSFSCGYFILNLRNYSNRAFIEFGVNFFTHRNAGARINL